MVFLGACDTAVLVGCVVVAEEATDAAGAPKEMVLVVPVLVDGVTC